MKKKFLNLSLIILISLLSSTVTTCLLHMSNGIVKVTNKSSGDIYVSIADITKRIQINEEETWEISWRGTDTYDGNTEVAAYNVSIGNLIGVSWFNLNDGGTEIFEVHDDGVYRIIPYPEGNNVEKWHIETVDNSGEVGKYTSIKIDSNDNIHISYHGNHDNLKYAFYDGNEWKIETIINDHTVYGYITLILDSNENPHICYGDNIGTIKYVFYDGNKWQIETVDYNNTFNVYASLALDSYDYPHIAYCDYDYTGLKYANYDGNIWHKFSLEEQYSNCRSSSISLDSNNYPHISYDGNLGLTYLYFDGSSWNEEVIDSCWLDTYLIMDNNNYPHICYQSGDYYLKYAYYDGNKWQTEIIDYCWDSPYCSMTMDSNGYPHISYYRGGLKYAYYDGNKWNVERITTNECTGKYTSIVLDSNGKPHISYYDYSDDYPNWNLKYAYFGLKRK